MKLSNSTVDFNMKNVSRKIKYSDIEVGMKIVDFYGNIGIVKDTRDIHNIFVEFTNGGSALYCLLENCEDGADSIYFYEE